MNGWIQRPNVEWKKKQVYTEWQCLYEVKKTKKETHHDIDQNIWGRIIEWKQIRGNMLGFWKCSISWSEWLLHKVHLHKNLFIYISQTGNVSYITIKK